MTKLTKAIMCVSVEGANQALVGVQVSKRSKGAVVEGTAKFAANVISTTEVLSEYVEDVLDNGQRILHTVIMGVR